MAFQTYRPFLRGTWIFIGLIISLWILNLDLSPKYLTLNITGETTQKEDLSVFFMKKNVQATSSTRPFTPSLSPQTFYFEFPKHFLPEYVFIDLGTEPSKWVVSSIKTRSHFFLLNLDAYEWNFSDMGDKIGANKLEVEIDVAKDEIKVSALKKPGRFYFYLDDTFKKSTPELLLVKAFSIITLIGAFIFVSSGYFWNLFASRKDDVELHQYRFYHIWKNDKPWIMLGSLLLLFAIIVLRYADLFPSGLHIEDTMELSDAMSGDVSLFNPETYQYYRGYTVFLTKLLVQAAYLFPLTWQPYLYALISTVTMCFAMAVMAYSGLFKNRFILLIAPLTLCLCSFTVSVMYISMTGILFSATALLMAMAVRPAPKSNAALLFYLLFAAALAFSGPYSPQLFPLAFGLLLFNASGKKSIILVTIMLLTVAYVLSSAGGMIQLSNVLDANTRAAFFNAFARYIFLLEIFPTADYKAGLAVIIAVVGILIAFRHDRLYIKHSLIFLAVSIASMCTYFISFKYGQYGGEIIDSHTVISQFCWVIFILLSVDKFLEKIPSETNQVIVNLCLFVVICVVILSRDEIKYKPQVNVDLPHFLAAVDSAKSLQLKDNEFIQLLHVTPKKHVVSVKIGANNLDSVSVDANSLPHDVRTYFSSVSLDRKPNMHLYFDKGRVLYMDGSSKEIP